MIKAAIIVFPGTNCEVDTKRACEYFGWEAEYIWHKEKISKHYDVIFLPGGFSYGDYVSSGRLAKFSNAIQTLPVGKTLTVGICNGFQILCEAGYIEGSLTYNKNINFLSEYTSLNFWDINSPYKTDFTQITLPIAHHQGNFVTSDAKAIRDKIFLTYNDNKNGSDADIAGIFDKDKKIMAMMPHPERAIFKETGLTEGKIIFELIQNEI